MDIAEGCAVSCSFDGDRFICRMKDISVTEGTEERLYTDADITMNGFAVKYVDTCARRVLDFKSCRPKDIAPRRLYKSELAPFLDRIVSEQWLLFGLNVSSDNAGSCRVLLRIYFTESGDMFDMTACCGNFDFSPYGKGAVPCPPKLTLYQRLAAARLDAAALFYAMTFRETPAAAKILAGMAVGYAMSPVDLIPDFIPLLGYLDDLIILPLLVYGAVRLIPPAVMDKCRKKVRDSRFRLPKKWFYALPVIIIWILIIVLIISAVI